MWCEFEPASGSVIASAPMLILYIVFQKHFIRGLMAGGLAGLLALAPMLGLLLVKRCRFPADVN